MDEFSAVDRGLLVGRERELERFDLLLDALDGGRGRVLTVTGEPGIGKTRLVHELVCRAQGRGHLVLRGRAAEFEQEVPFGPVVDALDRFLDSVEVGRLEERLSPEHVGELAAVFPALAARDHEWTGTGLQVERYRLHRAVEMLLQQLAQEQPLVFVLDDVHWADAASLELVAHLLRRRPEAPVLVVLAYRPHQVPAKLVAAVGAAAREGEVVELPVRPLTPREADVLLGDTVGPEERSALYHDSGGNPFYLEELSRARRAGGGGATPGVRQMSARRGEVPQAVRVAIAEELAALSLPAETVIRAAAVVGATFDAGLVAVVADLSERDALQAIDELLARDLVRATEVARHLVFRHPVVRQAVYESAGGGWRLAAHGRAAAALSERGAPVATLAHHVEHSAGTGDEEAIALLTRAGRMDSVRAPAAAARWYAAALRLMALEEDGRRRLELLVPLAVAQVAGGRTAEARKTLVEALELIPGESESLRIQIIVLISRVDHMLGQHRSARAQLRRALTEVEDHKAVCKVNLALSVDHWHAREWDEMTKHADTALSMAVALDDRWLYGKAAVLVAVGEHLRGETEASIAHIQEVEAILADIPDDRLATWLGPLTSLGYTNRGLERHDVAIEQFERALRVVRATGQDYFYVLVMVGLGACKVSVGRISEAAQHAEAAIEASLLLADDQMRMWAGALQTWTAIVQGSMQAALRAGEEGSAAAARAPDGHFAPFSHCFYGQALIEAGEPARGRDTILAGGGGPELDRFDVGIRAYWYGCLTEAEIALGNLDAAETWVERAAAVADRVGLRARAANAELARAKLLLARGDAATAVSCAVEAADGFAQVGQPIDVALAQTIAGRAAAASDQPELAAELLEQAHRALSSCGAQRYADEASRDLRSLGRRVARSGARGTAGEGVEALSAREREVAELVARGLTNRAIATELYLSAKTVETHLSHIFGKLGVRSRAAVAARIASATEEV